MCNKYTGNEQYSYQILHVQLHCLLKIKHSKKKPGIMFVNEYSPDDDVNADATNSSESVNSSTFTPEGPPLFEQLLPPTGPTTLPDIMNLHGVHMY